MFMPNLLLDAVHYEISCGMSLSQTFFFSLSPLKKGIVFTLIMGDWVINKSIMVMVIDYCRSCIVCILYSLTGFYGWGKTAAFVL